MHVYERECILCLRAEQINHSLTNETGCTFTFMHLADAFIQSDLQLHSGYTFSLVHEN